MESIDFTQEEYEMILMYMKASESVSPKVAVMNAISVALDDVDNVT